MIEKRTIAVVPVGEIPRDVLAGLEAIVVANLAADVVLKTGIALLSSRTTRTDGSTDPDSAAAGRGEATGLGADTGSR